jgi:serine/threonine protein kinase
MAEQSRQAKSIFLAAIEEHMPEHWSAFLEQACAGDVFLRARVEKLLHAQASLGSFHEARRLALPATLDEPVTERPGTIIGPYKLLEQIGEGGFGIVFMAEQQKPIRRQVALKVLKPGMDTKQVIARFESERQALALMDHPNISRVLDAGATDSGRPYFVMELVKGVSITEFCDKNCLAPEARLRLFIDVCHAIQHAHHKGIIHRDIKPTNVMVTLHDGVPVVKVIDFGIAKATVQKLTERTLFTAYGQMIGTLEYMSPEQAEMSELDIDTRSDVYALGVLLYELLTGTTPLEGKRLRQAGYAELLRLIREEEAPRPSTRLSSLGDTATVLAGHRGLDVRRLTQLLAGDLDWVAMKALEKDRNHRFDTPGSFAADVDRYLRGEPIVARPRSTVYKVRKFTQRHRAAVLTATAVAVLLLGGAAIAGWQALRATRAEAAALDSVAAEKRAKEDAAAREAETKAVLDFVVNRVFAAARLEGSPWGLGREVTLRKALETALPYVEKSFTKEPLIEARLRLTLGTSFADLGDHRTAAEQFEAARALFSRLRGPDHPDTLGSANNLANSYCALGRYADALKIHAKVLAIEKAKLGPDHPDTLRSMNNLASSYHALDRHAEALKLREDALARYKAALPDKPDTFTAMTNLANSYAALGRHAEALTLREETLTRQKAVLGHGHPDTLRSMNNLAGSYYALGRYDDAVKLDEKALALEKDKLGPDHAETLTTMSNLAVTYGALGRHTDALKLNEEVLSRRKAALGPDHPGTLRSMTRLANNYFALGRHADALTLSKQAVAFQKVKLGPDHSDTLQSMVGLADSYTAVGRPADALGLFEETLARRKATLGPDHPNTLLSMWGVADSLVRLGRGAEAVPVIDECVRRAADKVVAPGLLPRVIELRLRCFEKAGDAAGCRQTAKMWEDLKHTDAGSLYIAACLRAVAAAVLRGTELKSVLEATDANAEADRAMAWLKQAVTAGYKNAAHIKRNKDLDALRGRADFTKLVATLEGIRN